MRLMGRKGGREGRVVGKSVLIFLEFGEWWSG